MSGLEILTVGRIGIDLYPEQLHVPIAEVGPFDPVRSVRLANAAGAIVASRLLCAPAMPTVAELLRFEERVA